MSEFISGIKIRDLFLHNGNWWKLFLKHRHLIRSSIITNVLKLLTCRTSFLGYHFFVCPICKKNIKVPHSCKSRFCSSCGKKATDNWIKNSFNIIPDTKWQHITFTLPALLRNFFWLNRHLMNKIPKIAANIIKTLANQKGFIPGIYLAIHTFGRDIKRNIHIHLSTTAGGPSLTLDKWVHNIYFYHDTLKSIWRFQIISLLRNEFKTGHLKLPAALKHIKSYKEFRNWTSQFYNVTWVVHLNKQSNNLKINVEYLGKYLKRPPISETRIKAYDGVNVTYSYFDHYTDTTVSLSLPVLEFISRLISHIPDKYFRNIRYYGFLSNRLRSKLLPIVNKLLNVKKTSTSNLYTPWRALFKNIFNIDPLKCKICNTLMQLRHVVFPFRVPIISLHKEIAHGYFPLLL